LEKVRLLDLVKRSAEGLDLPLGVGAQGVELSHGQQQLICIARALLRGCKILICDEATSSVDDETDQLVQEIIRQNFVGCTVLTVAHRIGTIMDADRVLVMAAGAAEELGPPHELAARAGSRFAALVDKSKDQGGVDGGDIGVVDATEVELLQKKVTVVVGASAEANNIVRTRKNVAIV
jgi:ATP-binding cassette subfamily C (CFTR/MRP) protein 1